MKISFMQFTDFPRMILKTNQLLIPRKVLKERDPWLDEERVGGWTVQC